MIVYALLLFALLAQFSRISTNQSVIQNGNPTVALDEKVNFIYIKL